MDEPRDVVERGERDVLRNPQPARTDRVQCAEGHQVVGGEDRVGRLGKGQEPLGGTASAVRLEVALTDVGIGQRKPVLTQGVAEGLHALAAGGGGSRAGDDRQPAVAQAVQMGDKVAHRGTSVGAHHRHVHPGNPAVHEDHGGAAARGVEYLRGAAVGGRDEEPVDPAVEQRTDVVVLQLGPLVGVSDDDAVPEGARRFLDRASQRGEVRVEYIADDQPEGARLVGAQRPGDGVGPVAERVDSSEDAGPRVGADGRMTVEDARHRGDGHARLGCDIFDARHCRTTSLWFP